MLSFNFWWNEFYEILINFEFKNIFHNFLDQRSIFEALYTIFLTDKKRNFPFPQPNYSHLEEAYVVVERVFSPQWFYVRSSGLANKKRVDAIKQEPDLFNKKETRHYSNSSQSLHLFCLTICSKASGREIMSGKLS